MNAAGKRPERTSLYLRESGFDKEYHIAIEPEDGLFTVSYAYRWWDGRLQTGTKTPSPVAWSAARKIHERIVREKRRIGYSEHGHAPPHEHANKRMANLPPQLSKPVSEAEARQLLHDPLYCAQEHLDGRRLFLERVEVRDAAANKSGFATGLPAFVRNEVHALYDSLTIDGEIAGSRYHVFDLLEWNGWNLEDRPYGNRLALLANMLAMADHRCRRIHLIRTAFTTRQKIALWNRLKHANREGIVFKRLNASCKCAGAWLQFKFHHKALVFVLKVNRRRSVEAGVFRRDQLVSCGHIAIPAGQETPAVGDIIQVRYRHAGRDRLVLRHAVCLCVRDDIDARECTAQQLQFRAV
jgi:hypothetical protein